jgi:hypothetical protein
MGAGLEACLKSSEISPDAVRPGKEPIGAVGGEKASSIDGKRPALTGGKPIPIGAVRGARSNGGEGSGTYARGAVGFGEILDGPFDDWGGENAAGEGLLKLGRYPGANA